MSGWLRFAPKGDTKAQMRLFQRLNREHINFVTEVHVARFKVDFLISPNLVLEIDGESHQRDSRRRKDAWKDSVLRREGFKVLRFTDRQVRKDLDGVVEEIKKEATN